MQDRSLKGAGQVYSRSRADAAAGEEYHRSRAGAGKDQDGSKVGVVHVPNFPQIVLRRRRYALLVTLDWSVQ